MPRWHYNKLMNRNASPLQEQIGSRLAELRESRKLERSQIAKDLGCSYNNYCRYESGQRRVPYEVLLDAADYYGVSADYLLGRAPVEGGALSSAELTLIEHYRSVDFRARQDALSLLALHMKSSHI